MVLLGDEVQLEARFGPFRDSANLDARSVHGLRQMLHRLGNCFAHPIELLADVGLVECHFGPLQAVLVSAQDRCTVCAKRTIGSKIIFDTPDGNPR
jgi:hypothetical protein